MKPIDFVVFDGNSQPNISVHLIAEAMHRPLRVWTEKGEVEILSYYYDSESKQMILDIGEPDA